VGAALTIREKQILERVRDGYQYGEISEELDISVSTVKTYMRFALAKLGATNATTAVIAAIRCRAIDLEGRRH